MKLPDRPAYTQQDCQLTILEALEEFYLKNPKAVRHTGDELRDGFFRSHDMIHVVFGCDTNIHDEALADMWTIFGTDLGFRNYLKYLGPIQEDLKDVVIDAGAFELIWQVISAIPDVFVVFAQSRKMSKKWHWHDHHKYIDRPLNQVRDGLNIKVIDGLK